MRIMLDECLPRRLKNELAGHAVVTVPEAGLAGTKNGRLLTAIEPLCDCFITVDGGMEYQNKVINRPYAVVVLHAKSNRYDDLVPLVPALQSLLANLLPGNVWHLPPALS